MQGKQEFNREKPGENPQRKVRIKNKLNSLDMYQARFALKPH